MEASNVCWQVSKENATLLTLVTAKGFFESQRCLLAAEWTEKIEFLFFVKELKLNFCKVASHARTPHSQQCQSEHLLAACWSKWYPERMLAHSVHISTENLQNIEFQFFLNSPKPNAHGSDHSLLKCLPLNKWYICCGTWSRDKIEGMLLRGETADPSRSSRNVNSSQQWTMTTST